MFRRVWGLGFRVLIHDTFTFPSQITSNIWNKRGFNTCLLQVELDLRPAHKCCVALGLSCTRKGAGERAAMWPRTQRRIASADPMRARMLEVWG